jgi:predicted anti-sigma-YlaC factor YlaD
MTTRDIPICEQVQMAAMAHLDGERADLTAAEVETHLAACAECRTAVAALATVHSRLNGLDDESLDPLEVDVWPGVHNALTSGAPHAQPERQFVLALASVLVLWRLAQLSIDLPAPVVNSVVPFALTVLVLWRVTGDPFAIQVTTHQLQREGVS